MSSTASRTSSPAERRTPASAARTIALTLEAPAGSEDELAGRLWQLGSLGNWSVGETSSLLRLRAAFPASAVESELRAALEGLDGVRVLDVEILPEIDWLAAWRQAAQPIPVGARFLVDPREPDAFDPGRGAPPRDAGGRWILRLPARTAFGVGSHESTRLALELLETANPAGRRVLDVGTGTGILAFAALVLGAREVVAFDLDPAAALLLPAYMRLNGLRPRAFTGTLAALGPAAGTFDLALVNVLPHEIASELPALRSLLAPGARVALSGLLTSEIEASLVRLAPLGLREIERRSAAEWSGLMLEVVP